MLQKSRRRKISFNDIELELHNQHKTVRSIMVHPTPAGSPPLVDTPDSIVSTSAFHSTRSTAPPSSSSVDGEEWCWERVLCSDPEMLIRQASRNSEAEDESPLALQRKAVEEQRQKESLLNPTPAMLALIQKIEEREYEREQLNWQQQLQHLTGKKGNSKSANQWMDLTQNPLTPAMEEVINMRAKRVSIEVDVPITPEPSDDELDFDDLDVDVDSDSSHEEYRPPTPKRKKKSSSSARARTSIIPSVSVQNLMSAPNKIRNKSNLKPKNKRRISIQNEAEPIHNKKSRKTKTSTSNKKSTRAPTRCSSRLRIKSTDSNPKLLVEDHVESTDAKKIAVTDIIPVMKKKCPITVKDSVKTQKKEEPEDSPQLKWEKVLRVNPERLLKKKNTTTLKAN